MAVSSKPLSPPNYTMIGHVDSGLYSAAALYLYLPCTFLLRIYLWPFDRFYLYFSIVRSGGTYPIPLSVVVLSIVQVSAPDSSTIVDVICLYFSTVRSSDTHSIPSGSFVLTSVRVQKAELIQTVDLIRLDRRPLIHIPH